MKIEKEELKNTLLYLDTIQIDGFIDDIEFDEFLRCFDENWSNVSDDTFAYIRFRYCDDSPSMSLAQLINITKQLEDSSIDYNKGAALTKNGFMFCIDTSDYNSIELFENLVNYNESIVSESEFKEKRYWMHSLTSDGCTTCIYLLTDTVTDYHLLLEKSHDISEYFPAYNSYESFICISSNNELTIENAEALVDSFLFELNSTLELQFVRKIRTKIEMDDIEEESFYHNCSSYEEYVEKKGEIENVKSKKYNSKDYSLLPIMHGRGIHGVIKIYNKAIETYDTNYKILNYARVIEYISPTIARQELVENVLEKLDSIDTQILTADLVLTLGENYKKYDTMKDRDLCRAAINILNYEYIAQYAPEFMKHWADWNEPQNRKVVITRIADSITATRNEIAHAKANYQRCGLECPEKFKDAFAVMLQKIAELLIRWYSRQPEKIRITD